MNHATTVPTTMTAAELLCWAHGIDEGEASEVLSLMPRLNPIPSHHSEEPRRAAQPSVWDPEPATWRHRPTHPTTCHPFGLSEGI